MLEVKQEPATLGPPFQARARNRALRQDTTVTSMRLRNRVADGFSWLVHPKARFAKTLTPGALLFLGIAAFPALLQAQAAPPAALGAGELPAAGLLYTDAEKQLSGLFASLRAIASEQPTSLAIWCGEPALCDALREALAGLPARPTSRLIDPALLASKLSASAKQFTKGAPKVRPKLVLPTLKDAAVDGVSVLATIADKGVYYLAELAPTKTPGTFELVSLPVAQANLDELKQKWRDAAGKLLASKKRVDPASSDTRSELSAPMASELAWGDLREQTRTRSASETLTRGLKDNLADDAVLSFDGRCSLLGGTKGRTPALASCVQVNSLRAQFPTVDPGEPRKAGQSVDLTREGLVPGVAQQAGYQSDASWAVGYAAYGNLVLRGKQAGVVQPAASGAFDAMQLHNLAKSKKAGKALVLAKSDAGKLKPLLAGLDNSQAADLRGCFGGTSLPQVVALLNDLEPAALAGEPSGCAAAATVQLRKTAALLPAIQARVIDADLDAIRAALLMRAPVVVSAPTALFDGYAGGIVSSGPSTRDASSANAWTQSYYTAAGPRGHHAVTVVGFDNSEQTLKLQNSWGGGWGEGGFMRVHYDVFRAWFHDVAYYLDCVGQCAAQRPQVATLNLRLGVDYQGYRDSFSPPDPLLRVRKNGGLVCELSAQDSAQIEAACAPMDLAPNDLLTLELWERDQGSSDYLGGFRYAPISASGEVQWQGFHLRGGQSLALTVPKEVKSLFKEGTAPAVPSRTGGRRERTTAAPGRPGAERKK